MRCSTPQSISILNLFDPTACCTKKKSPRSPRYIRMDTVPVLVREGWAELSTAELDDVGVDTGSEIVFFRFRTFRIGRLFFAAVLAGERAFFCPPTDFHPVVRVFLATFAPLLTAM